MNEISQTAEESTGQGKDKPLIVIRASDYQEFGCPHCGGINSQCLFEKHGERILCCKSKGCNKGFIVIPERETESRGGVPFSIHPRGSKSVNDNTI